MGNASPIGSNANAGNISSNSQNTEFGISGAIGEQTASGRSRTFEASTPQKSKPTRRGSVVARERGTSEVIAFQRPGPLFNADTMFDREMTSDELALDAPIQSEPKKNTDQQLTPNKAFPVWQPKATDVDEAIANANTELTSSSGKLPIILVANHAALPTEKLNADDLSEAKPAGIGGNTRSRSDGPDDKFMAALTEPDHMPTSNEGGSDNLQSVDDKFVTALTKTENSPTSKEGGEDDTGTGNDVNLAKRDKNGVGKSGNSRRQSVQMVYSVLESYFQVLPLGL